MVGGSSRPSPHSDALRGEIELLRAAVAALRATRREPAARPAPKPSTMTVSIVSFAAGVSVTLASAAVVIYVIGLCR